MNFIKLENNDGGETLINFDNVAYITQNYDYRNQKIGCSIHFLCDEMEEFDTSLNLLAIENRIKKSNQKG